MPTLHTPPAASALPRPRRILHVAADAIHLVPARLRPDLTALGDSIVRRLPLALQRDLARGGDRAVRDAAEAVGAPEMVAGRLVEPLLAVPGWALARGGLRAAPLSAAGPFRIDPNALPATRDPLYGSPAFGFGGGDGGGQGVAAPQNVRRSPFVMWGGTSVTAGDVVYADANSFTNTSQRRFIVTHVTFSQNREDAGQDFAIELAPIFYVKITPSVTNRPWMLDRIDARGILSNSPYGNVPNVQGYDISRWAFPFEYRLGRNQANYVTIGNEATASTAGVAVALIGYKDDVPGTPRVFFDSGILAASASSGTPLNGQKYRGDGDADVMLTDMVTAWECVTPSSPLVFVRPDQASAWGTQTSGTPAVAMNNVPGMLGAYWELRRPQLIEPSTTITVEIEGPTGIADVRANVGFLGYIEEPG